jgi:hypothetical protein
VKSSAIGARPQNQFISIIKPIQMIENTLFYLSPIGGITCLFSVFLNVELKFVEIVCGGKTGNRRKVSNQVISRIKRVKIIVHTFSYLSPIGAGPHLWRLLLKSSSNFSNFRWRENCVIGARLQIHPSLQSESFR